MEGPSVILFRGGETHSRSVTKAISWRALGTIDTFAISWFMTGRVEIAGSIAGVEIITKIAWYYLHTSGSGRPSTGGGEARSHPVSLGIIRTDDRRDRQLRRPHSC
jgi:uncharacterized membrane protein